MIHFCSIVVTRFSPNIFLSTDIFTLDILNLFCSLGYEYVAGDKPPVVAAKDASGLKYRMAEVTDAKEFMPSLKEFLTQLEAGNLEPYLKSEAVPDNSANAVKVAVAKNFDDLVMKSEKDVLVEFYAPW